MGKRIEENKKVCDKILNIMLEGELNNTPESEKTEQILRFLLVDMSVNLAIIADKLLEGEK